MSETREELLRNVERWESELSGDGPVRGTLEVGMGNRGVAGAETLLRAAVSQLLPEAEIPDKPTLGQLVDLIRRDGRKHRMECLGLPRRLVTVAEFDVLASLTSVRNRLVHPDATVADVREVLGVVRATAELPLFDEIDCRMEILRDDQEDIPSP